MKHFLFFSFGSLSLFVENVFYFCIYWIHLYAYCCCCSFPYLILTKSNNKKPIMNLWHSWVHCIWFNECVKIFGKICTNCCSSSYTGFIWTNEATITKKIFLLITHITSIIFLIGQPNYLTQFDMRSFVSIQLNKVVFTLLSFSWIFLALSLSRI